MRRWGGAVAALMGLLLALPLGRTWAQDAAGPATIVLMIADDQHYGDFGFMGHPAARTPHLDRLADEGALFPVAHVAMSRCRPSLASLLTGMYPHQHGVTYNFAGPELRKELDTLPRQLRRTGYACWMGGKYWEGDPRAHGFSHRGRGFKELVRNGQDSVRGFLSRVEGQPAFLWWAPMLPHVPHDPPERLVAAIDEGKIPRPAGIPDRHWEDWRAKQRTVLAMGAWLDEGVGELMEILGEYGRLENTLIVFLADNGYDPTLPAKGSPYERGFRTPLILWDSGRIEAGSRIDRLASGVDVVPTVLDWTGAEPMADAAGSSLWPLVEERQGAWRDRLHGASYPRGTASPETPRAEEDVQALYVRTERWKYIVYVREIVAGTADGLFYFSGAQERRVIPRGTEELFDLETDPEELENLAGRAEHGEMLRELRRSAFAWWTSTGGGPLAIGSGDLPIPSEPEAETP